MHEKKYHSCTSLHPALVKKRSFLVTQKKIVFLTNK
jgi:hypothetical protein